MANQPCAAIAGTGQVRCLNVHEYVSMQMMEQHDIDHPASKMAETPEGAEKACAEIMGGDRELHLLGPRTRLAVFCSLGPQMGRGGIKGKQRARLSRPKRHEGMLVLIFVFVMVMVATRRFTEVRLEPLQDEIIRPQHPAAPKSQHVPGHTYVTALLRLRPPDHLHTCGCAMTLCSHEGRRDQGSGVERRSWARALLERFQEWRAHVSQVSVLRGTYQVRSRCLVPPHIPSQ